jgi:hypothetical protein
MRKFFYIFTLVSLLFIACDNGSEEINLSKETRVESFTFYTDTTNPGLTEAVYKIEHRDLPDTGRIYCVDSLRFGTCLDSVIPYPTYKITPSSAVFYLADTSVVSTGADTLNFNQRPIYLFVQAADTAYTRWYRIDIHVHKADPELYIWKQMSGNLFAPSAAPEYSDKKAFYSNESIVLFVNNGFSTMLYQSEDGASWEAMATPEGLPTPCQVRDIMQDGETLYYVSNDKLYTSTDFVHWSEKDFSSRDFALVNMLVAFDGKVWCILQDRVTESLMLGVLVGDDIQPAESVYGLDGNILPKDFPVSDFSALSFTSSSERPRAMVVGGRTIDGVAVNSRWNLEYEASMGYRIVDFSIEQPSFNSLTGISVIQYDGHLVMFGGIDNDLDWRSDILYSDDEGMNWYAPDSAKNQLPSTYNSRHNQTVVVDEDQNIYVIGGQSFTQSYNDVYRGYLNELKWEALKND